jgi:small ligand-binding sensory domain FIST
VGILTFHPEFLETGAVRAVSEALPFDTIGGTSCNVAVPGAAGDLLLSLAVLTSDEVVFKAGASLPIVDDPRQALEELYTRLAPAPVRPSLLLTMAPRICHIGGDEFITALDVMSGGVPLFGSIAFTYREDLSGIETCYNGSRYSNVFTLIAMFGEVNAKFHLTPSQDGGILHCGAVVTQAEGNQIHSINGLAPLRYLESVGFVEEGSIVDIPSFPMVLILPDGSRVVRVVYWSIEEGYIQASGIIPPGSRIGFSNYDADSVLKSAQEAAQMIVDSNNQNALIFSCVARRWTLGPRLEAEMKELSDVFSEKISYHVTSSGGEFCPVRNRNGQLVNRFHNFTMVACSF